MISLDDVRAHMIYLRRRRVKMVGHRAMLARTLDEIDALTGALREARARETWLRATLARIDSGDEGAWVCACPAGDIAREALHAPARGQ